VKHRKNNERYSEKSGHQNKYTPDNIRQHNKLFPLDRLACVHVSDGGHQHIWQEFCRETGKGRWRPLPERDLHPIDRYYFNQTFFIRTLAVGCSLKFWTLFKVGQITVEWAMEITGHSS
jgi:hypothetical protein